MQELLFVQVDWADSLPLAPNAPLLDSRHFFVGPLCDEARRRRASVAQVQAYILIQTEVGKAAQVAKEVRDIDGVDAAEDVTGPYDVIVRASAPNVDDLGKLVVARIQAVEGITRTLTCPVVHL
jgi:DNA-binding Lrp family transcriptional regulator